MSFLNKNRIKLLLTIFFVVISFFGNVKNVFAQDSVNFDVDSAKKEVTNKTKESNLTSQEIDKFYEECSSFSLMFNGECSARYESNKIRDKEDKVRILNAEIETLNSKIKLYEESAKPGVTSEQLKPLEETVKNNEINVIRVGGGPNEITTTQTSPSQSYWNIAGSYLFGAAGGIFSLVGNEKGSCNYIKWDVGSCLNYAFAGILNLVVKTVAFFTTEVASEFFTLVINLSINSITSFKELDAVVSAWKVLRDLVNMFALLIMMYIAIGTVLDLKGVEWKKMIGNLIIAVILINFSMAITGVIIDTSNIFAVYFYEKTTGPNGNISNIIINKLGIYHQIEKGNASYYFDNKNMPSIPPSLSATAVNSIMTLITLIVLFYILMSTSVLFIVRTVSLIFALVFSPLPWLGMILPKFEEKISGKYWENLINQAFFAPAFMICLYVSIRIISCTNLLNTINGGGVKQFPIFGGTLNVIFMQALIMFFLIGSLSAAKKMGAAGASGAEAFGKWATGAAVGSVGGSAIIGFKGASGIYSGLNKYKEDVKQGNIQGSRLSYVGEEWKNTIGKPIADKISAKAGMVSQAVKETVKTPSNVAGFLGDKLKSATGLDILAGTEELKKAEKAEKDYYKKKEFEDAKKTIESFKGKDVLSSDENDVLSKALKKIKGDDLLDIDKDVIMSKAIAEKLSPEQIKTLEEKGTLAERGTETYSKDEIMGIKKDMHANKLNNFGGYDAVKSDVAQELLKKQLDENNGYYTDTSGKMTGGIAGRKIDINTGEVKDKDGNNVMVTDSNGKEIVMRISTNDKEEIEKQIGTLLSEIPAEKIVKIKSEVLRSDGVAKLLSKKQVEYIRDSGKLGEDYKQFEESIFKNNGFAKDAIKKDHVERRVGEILKAGGDQQTEKIRELFDEISSKDIATLSSKVFLKRDAAGNVIKDSKGKAEVIDAVYEAIADKDFPSFTKFADRNVREVVMDKKEKLSKEKIKEKEAAENAEKAKKDAEKAAKDAIKAENQKLRDEQDRKL